MFCRDWIGRAWGSGLGMVVVAAENGGCASENLARRVSAHGPGARESTYGRGMTAAAEAKNRRVARTLPTRHLGQIYPRCCRLRRVGMGGPGRTMQPRRCRGRSRDDEDCCLWNGWNSWE